jgi:hypothetical protein
MSGPDYTWWHGIYEVAQHTYFKRQSPHADVACVKCHVGSSVEAQIDAKLNGLHQLIAVTTGEFPRPIPTPVHNLRPSKETCRRCHWPDMPHGDKIKVLVRHEPDEASTPAT